MVSLSQYSLGDQPNATEVGVLQSLALEASKPFTETEDEHLLFTLHSVVTRHSVSNASPTPYMRTGTWWKYSLGFQHTDPISDIRGGGVLALQNLIYFLTNHPRNAFRMIKSRANQSLTDDYRYPSFPWACAGINLTRVLAIEYEIILPSGKFNTGINAQYHKKTTWKFISEPNGFNRMYVCLFLLLDRLWDEMGATYMEFNHVLKAVTDEFRHLLALSKSLTNLENRVHQRVKFVDPDIDSSDYTTLPEAATIGKMQRGSSFFDIECQEQEYCEHETNRSFSAQSGDNESDAHTTITYPVYNFLTANLPSYDTFMSSLVPEPMGSALPNYFRGEQNEQDHQHPHYQTQHFQQQWDSQLQRGPTCIQIV